ncbi:uncharacterized protein LOC114021181 isoform X2 [Chelonia mydas]|uniref:uncharacterized protein LOC114021181 isoform X2 n=1 Tax=Chelonia mydas TaxID=8469 RepID=UPI001CA9426B|nr:uncharacterized protein LOC114021181 isoform X2 [Chelonia mydas]
MRRPAELSEAPGGTCWSPKEGESVRAAGCQERHLRTKERSESECWALASELGQRIAALEAENRNLRCERDQLESRTRGLREELERSRSSMLHVGQKLKEQGGRARPGRFCLASIRDNGKWLRFYTGFGSAQRLAAFLAFLTEGEPRRGAEAGPPSALSPEDQLFLVLVRLRLGLLLQDLAFRFQLSEATASRYWLSWTQLMETRLAQVSPPAGPAPPEGKGPVPHSRPPSQSVPALGRDGSWRPLEGSRGIVEGLVHPSHGEEAWPRPPKGQGLPGGIGRPPKWGGGVVPPTWEGGVAWRGWSPHMRMGVARRAPRPAGQGLTLPSPSPQVPVRCSPRYVERFEPQRASRVGGVPLVVLDCAQLCFEGRGRQLYALQGCALAAPSGFLAFCCSAALPGGEGGGRAGAAPLPAGRPRGPQRPAGGGLPAGAQPGQPG